MVTGRYTSVFTLASDSVSTESRAAKKATSVAFFVSTACPFYIAVPPPALNHLKPNHT
jgi:hypothetical protein